MWSECAPSPRRVHALLAFSTYSRTAVAALRIGGRIDHAPRKANVFQESNPAMNFLLGKRFGGNAPVVILFHVALGADPTAQGTIALVFGGNVA